MSGYKQRWPLGSSEEVGLILCLCKWHPPCRQDIGAELHAATSCPLSLPLNASPVS